MRLRSPGPALLYLVLVAAVATTAMLLASRPPAPSFDEPAPESEALPAPDETPSPAPEPPPLLPDEKKTAVLTGRVLGEPVPVGGGWLALSGATEELRTTIDDDGGFLFPEVPPGVPLSLWLGPDPRGNQVSKIADKIVLEPGEMREMVFAAPTGASIRGLVTDTAGHPLDAVRVAVLDPTDDWSAPGVPVAAVTGKDGCFFVGFGEGTKLAPVRLVVDKVRDGYLLEERIVDPARTGGRVEQVVELKMGEVIAGKVIRPDGGPLCGAKVHILEDYRGDPRLRRPVEGWVRTDAKGCFRDNAYRSGVYRIFVMGTHAGVRYGTLEEGVVAGDENVKIRFPGFGTASFAFEDERTREPVEKGWIAVDVVWGHTGETEYFEVWEERSSTAATEFRLPEGHYRVRVRCPGYKDFRSDLFFVKARTDLGKVRFRLTPRGPR